MFNFRSFRYLLVIALLFSKILSASTEYKYSYIPKKVYENQLFPITIIAIGEKKPKQTTFTFDKSSPIQPLFKKPLVVKNAKDSFYTFYFKAIKTHITIPQLFISSYQTQTSLGARNIVIKASPPHYAFCGVIAADLKIVNSQVSHYDSKSHIVTVSIKALEANIEDIKLQKVIESGVDEIKRDYAKVTAEFYAVVSTKKKNLIFSYFNTIRKKFITLKVPIKMVNATVTTQSDLNPKEDSFKKLKKYTLIVLIIFFLIMAIFKRDFFYLIIVVVAFITLLTLYIPHQKICVKQGAPLYIIPTSTSTISTYIDEKHTTLLLDTKNKYHKVAYKKDIIGWIKNEDICKN